MAFDLFQSVVVINLAERTDRRADTERELGKISCQNAEFFPAVKPRSAGKFGGIGECGCYMSHLNVLKASVHKQNVLVLEDDVRFHHQFGSAAAFLDQLGQDWDVIYFGYGQLPSYERQIFDAAKDGHGAMTRAVMPSKVTSSGRGFARIDSAIELLGAHCYAVNGPAMPKLIERLELFLTRPRGHSDGGPMPVDGALNVARRQLGLRTVIAVPTIAYRRASKSDLTANRWFDRVPLLSGVAYRLRMIRNAAVVARERPILQQFRADVSSKMHVAANEVRSGK